MPVRACKRYAATHKVKGLANVAQSIDRLCRGRGRDKGVYQVIAIESLRRLVWGFIPGLLNQCVGKDSLAAITVEKVTGKVLALVGVKPVGAESERTVVCSHKPVVDFVKADRRFIDAAPNGQRHTSCRFPADSQ